MEENDLEFLGKEFRERGDNKSSEITQHPAIEKPELYFYDKTSNEIKKRSLQEARNKVKEKYINNFKKNTARPRVDTGLGFDVDGSYQDLLNFEVGAEFQLTTLKDADNNIHEVTAEDYNTIIQKIKENGIRLLSEKWQKEQEIENMTFKQLESFYDSEFK